MSKFEKIEFNHSKPVFSINEMKEKYDWTGDGYWLLKIGKSVVRVLRWEFKVESDDLDALNQFEAEFPSMFSPESVDENDVELLMKQTDCSREEAVRNLFICKHDLVEAIIRITGV